MQFVYGAKMRMFKASTLPGIMDYISPKRHQIAGFTGVKAGSERGRSTSMSWEGQTRLGWAKVLLFDEQRTNNQQPTTNKPTEVQDSRDGSACLYNYNHPRFRVVPAGRSRLAWRHELSF
jgi:hypothetical protein